MKTGLLKKLRTEAYRMYGIKNHIAIGGGGGVYIIGLRELSNRKDVGEYTLKGARKRLAEMRSEYCTSRVAELRAENRKAKYIRF